MEETKKTTVIGLITNIFLFIIKTIAALMTGSIAIISDAINSLLDVISSITIHFAVKLTKKESSARYPFGYKRAEPMAALLIALLAGILAFEIARSAVMGIIEGQGTHSLITPIPIIIMGIAIIVKIVLTKYFYKIGKKNDSPALLASSQDFRNDIFCSIIALLGFLGSGLKFYYIDDIAAIIVAGIIFYTGYQIGIKNIDYLMGKSPDDATLFEIRRRALNIEGVKKVKDVKAHYVGNFIHVEIEIVVDRKIDATAVHKINHDVRLAIEAIYHIDKVFVHMEPEIK